MGIGNFFNPENSFFTFLGKFVDVFVLNIVWLALHVPFLLLFFFYRQIFILPAAEHEVSTFTYITAGGGIPFFLVFGVLLLAAFTVFVPSMIAMYYAVVKSIRRSRSYPVKEFFRSFKLNFKQGAKASVLLGIIIALLSVDFEYTSDLLMAGDSKGVMFLGVFIVITFVIAGIYIYFCAVISRFTMTGGNAFKFSFGLSIKHFWCTFLSVFLWAAIILLIYLTRWFVGFFGIALGTLVESFMMEKVLKRYVLQTIEKQKSAEGNSGEKAADGTSAEEKPEYTESFEDGGENSKKDEWYLE